MATVLGYLSSDVKHNVSELIAKYSDQIDESTNLEIELGFNVSADTFFRVLNYYSDKLSNSKVSTDTVEIISTKDDNEESISYRKITSESGEEKWEIKKPVGPYGNRYYKSNEFGDNNYKVKVSIEQKIDPIDNFESGVNVVRKRKRFSFTANYGVKYDFTITDQTKYHEPPEPPEQSDEGSETPEEGFWGEEERKYEIEIEFPYNKFIEHVDLFLSNMIKTIQDTNLIYSKITQEKVRNYFNSIFNIQSTNLADVGVKVRNLKSRDLVYGGIAGNTVYTVTQKADGLRKFLLFSPWGVWLLSPPNSYNLVMEFNPNLETLSGYILDGEIVQPQKELESISYIFLASDCISVPKLSYDPKLRKKKYYGNMNIQYASHKERMVKAQDIANRIKYKELWVFTKNFLEIKSADSFFYNNSKLLNNATGYTIKTEGGKNEFKLWYPTDGLIFTPEYFPVDINGKKRGVTQYNPKSNSFPLYQRILTRMPDVCKWKPENTIDFYIKWNNGKLNLYTSRKDQLVLFEGNLRKSFSGEINPPEGMDKYNLPDGTIAEMTWKNDTFVIQRIRYDKHIPNYFDIAEDVWNDIHDPITEKTMRGETFYLAMKYHNKIKSELFNRFKDEGKTLLDLGSGRGGDIQKWVNAGFSKVVAVEPNLDNINDKTEEDGKVIEGLKTRSEKVKLPIKIIQSKAEDTELLKKEIGDEKFDVISMMLSLSFFWQSAEVLNQLVETLKYFLKPNGHFIFLTLDGDAVEQVFNPFTGPITAIEPMIKFYGEGFMKYDEGKLYTYLPNTIVGHQEEWLPRISDLMYRLPWNLESINLADKEKFLYGKESLFSRLYSYGVFSAGKLPGKKKTKNMVKRKEKKPFVPQIPVQEKLPLDPSFILSKVKETPQVIITRDDVVNLIPPHNENVDTVQPFREFTQIGVIGGASSFFHAFLMSFYENYQNNTEERVALVEEFRKELASLARSKYDTVDNGYWKQMYEKQLESMESGKFLNSTNIYHSLIDYSPEGMEKRISDPNQYVGEEVFSFLVENFNINLIVLDLSFNPVFVGKNNTTDVSVVVGNGVHFNVIGKGNVTLFKSGDPLIKDWLTALQ